MNAPLVRCPALTSGSGLAEVGVGPCVELDHHNRLGPTPDDNGPTAAAVTKTLTANHADGAVPPTTATAEYDTCSPP